MATLDKLKQKVLKKEYEFTIPHFFEEMANDNLVFMDIENAMLKGRINRKLTRDPRGTRYEVVGPAKDGRPIAVICKIKSTSKLLFITTYAAE